MIVGCYSIDLYCDGEYRHGYQEDMAQFADADESRCYRQARRAGWVVNTREQKAYCPTCAKLRRSRRKKAITEPKSQVGRSIFAEGQWIEIEQILNGGNA